MKTYKPLDLPQMKLVTGIMGILSEHNKGLVHEVDFTLMNPVIAAVNNLIPKLMAHNDGKQCFVCHCEDEHDDECELNND